MCGQMVQSIKANGEIMLLMVKVHFGMLREMYTKVNFMMTKLTAMVFTRMLMEASMKVIGKMICKKVTVVKFGVMVPNIMDNGI